MNFCNNPEELNQHTLKVISLATTSLFDGVFTGEAGKRHPLKTARRGSEGGRCTDSQSHPPWVETTAAHLRSSPEMMHEVMRRSGAKDLRKRQIGVTYQGRHEHLHEIPE